MSIPRKITEFLDSHHVAFQHFRHSPMYTAQETAHARHVSGKELAKTVMLVADDSLAMVVLPTSHQVELPKIQEKLKIKFVRLASEDEFKEVFPGCELGAMPPLGKLYNIDVGMNESLRERNMILFNAGTPTDTVRMIFSDFKQLVRPHVESLASVTH